MSKIFSTIGIILVVTGTIFSLWSILSTKDIVNDVNSFCLTLGKRA
jgi:hypothetical protein